MPCVMSVLSPDRSLSYTANFWMNNRIPQFVIFLLRRRSIAIKPANELIIKEFRLVVFDWIDFLVKLALRRSDEIFLYATYFVGRNVVKFPAVYHAAHEERRKFLYTAHGIFVYFLSIGFYGAFGCGHRAVG